MVFKRFRIIILTRISLLCSTVSLFFFLLLRTNLYATVIIVGVAGIYQVYSLIRYVEKTNRDLNRFLLAIKHSDFTQTFTSAGMGPSFDRLNEAFSEVIEEFQRTRSDKEEHYRYLQTVVQHVGIGLMAYTKNGDIELINTAAKRLLQTSHLKNIRMLSHVSAELVEKLKAIKSGQKALVKVIIENDLLQLAVFATEFKLRDRQYTLVSLQNIHSELEEKEMEAWQKLIRVLTHEIMNSITPISSLASTVNDMIGSEDGSRLQSLNAGTVRDITGALRTIRKRSDGLLHFVDAYRDLTLIPHPEFEIIKMHDLFVRLEKLMKAQAIEQGIEFQTSVEPESIELTADPKLIEQVLINLIMNSLQALDSQPGGYINLKARLSERGRALVQVADNGPGISDEQIDRIFIPFFTTKQKGSGIGLSLSRQIMRLHRGSISVSSSRDRETVFTLKF